MIMALLGSCPSHVTRMEAKFLHLAKSIKPVNGGPGLESELCLPLACSYCILSHARDLHTLSCPAMPSLVCCCGLLFPGRPCLWGAHGHWNGKGPSLPCFLLTFPPLLSSPRLPGGPNKCLDTVHSFPSEYHTTSPRSVSLWASRHCQAPWSRVTAKFTGI